MAKIQVYFEDWYSDRWNDFTTGIEGQKSYITLKVM